MARATPSSTSACSGFNQVTVLQQWTTQQFIDGMQRHGIGAIAIWRDKLRETGVAEIVRMLRGHRASSSPACARPA